ncbi:pentapeptide repeat-containing protein [Streptomyces violaceoruber]|uniref:pentapeptide repeat-containing protein n=1 Tax=Streptomyces violaceoruber group TaxID=2867121 RepID=UPI003408ACCA
MTVNRRPHPTPDDRELRLWKVGRALTLAFVAAVLVAGGIFYGLVELLDFKEIDSTAKLDAKTLFDLVKLSFGVVAGAGALVALVVAYRRQRVDEVGAHREATRLHTERFSQAVDKLGSDSPAVRLGGVHALAGLADDAPDDSLRQTCIDVLCAYLQLPFTSDPGDDPTHQEEHHRYLAFRKVRHTILRLIGDHYRRPQGTHRSWQGCDLDLTGVTIDCDVSFDGATFSDGTVSFDGATFSDGTVSFGDATFSSGAVSFHGATFSSGMVRFDGATFCGSRVSFSAAVFSGSVMSFRRVAFSGGAVAFNGATFADHGVTFQAAAFSGCDVSFMHATFSGSTVYFEHAAFSGGEVSFREATFPGGEVSFREATFSNGEVLFLRARFLGGLVSFCDTRFSGGLVAFNEAVFPRGEVSFRGAAFSSDMVIFHDVEFSGGAVAFREATGLAPRGVMAAVSTSASDSVTLPSAWQAPSP